MNKNRLLAQTVSLLTVGIGRVDAGPGICLISPSRTPGEFDTALQAAFYI